MQYDKDKVKRLIPYIINYVCPQDAGFQRSEEDCHKHISDCIACWNKALIKEELQIENTKEKMEFLTEKLKEMDERLKKTEEIYEKLKKL